MSEETVIANTVYGILRSTSSRRSGGRVNLRRELAMLNDWLEPHAGGLLLDLGASTGLIRALMGNRMVPMTLDGIARGLRELR